VSLAFQLVQDSWLSTRADRISDQNLKYNEYKELLDQSTIQINELNEDSVVMSTIKTKIKNEEELKLIKNEANQA